MASVMRYGQLSPGQAGFVQAAEDYAWSSAVMRLGGMDVLGLLDVETWRRD